MGGETYYWYNGGTWLSTSFDHTYDWSNMPDQLYWYSSSVQKNAVSTLMRDVGYLFHMNYGVEGSGAAPWNYYRGLVDHFGYNPKISSVWRSDFSSDGDWFKLFKDEIDSLRPVGFSMWAQETDEDQKHPGHTTVVDGYRIDSGMNQVHINFGWENASGSDDYYVLNNLIDPCYKYHWTYNQHAIYYITPVILKLQSPKAGDKFAPGDNCSIVWDEKDTRSGEIQIFYRTSPTATPNFIATLPIMPNTCRSYNWTVPNENSTQCQILIVNNTPDGAYMDSDLSGFFTIQPKQPQLSLTPSSLDFGSSQTNLTLTVQNIGGGTLSWYASKSRSWLSLSQSSGSLEAGKSLPITVSVSRSGLSPGNYSDTISFTSNGGNQNVSVSMSVPPVPTQPTISGRVTRADNSQGLDGVTITFSNGGGSVTTSGGGYYSKQVSSGWSGRATPSYSGGGSFNPTFRDYTNVTSDQANQNYTWSPPSQPTIRVLSPNGGDVWHLGNSESIRWESSGLTGNVKIELNRDYPSGSWETLFASTTNDGEESWIVIGGTSSRCRIRITSIDQPDFWDISDSNFAIAGPEPQLFVSPNVLDFGYDQTTLSFKVKNIGGGVLWWNATESVDWITGINPPNGNLSANQEVEVTVTITREGQSPGEHQDKIRVAASNGNVEEVTVKMKVPYPGAQLWLEPSTGSVSSPQPDFTLTLKVGAVSNIRSIFASLTWDTSKLSLNTSIANNGVEYGSLFWGGAVTATPDPEGMSLLAEMYGSSTSGPGEVAKIHFTVPSGLPIGTTIAISFRSSPAATITLGSGLLINPQTTGATLTVGGAPPPPSNSFNLNLSQGWNAISLPLVTDPRPATVFQGVKGDWALFWWDPTLPGPNGMGGYVINPNLAPGKGYWMKIFGGSQVVTISGSPCQESPFNIPLYSGWNMIGNPFLKEMSVGLILVETQGRLMTIEEAMNTGVISPFFLYNGTGYELIFASGQFVPGKGYWVKAFQNCTLVVFNPPPD